jgi:hypothetical protein
MAQSRRGTKHYLLILRAEPGVHAIRALRAALKALKRHYGLRVVSVMEEDRDQVLRDKQLETHRGSATGTAAVVSGLPQRRAGNGLRPHHSDQARRRHP